MNFLKQNIGRRQFVSTGSMVLGAALLAKPSGLLLAAETSSQVPAVPKPDGTKYGKYITLSQKYELTERGLSIFPMGGDFEGFSTVIIGRLPPPGPYPTHEAPEKHDGEIELLIHLGNNQEDPMELGGEMDFFLGKGKWLERQDFKRSTVVYVPNGQWHCPWKVKTVREAMTFMSIRIGKSAEGGMPGIPGGMPGGAPSGDRGGAPGGFSSGETLSQEARAKAKTSGRIFDKYLLSGVSKDMKDPEGGKWIAYTDCTKIDSSLLIRTIRYRPDKAPYSVINMQTHEYGTLFMFLGIDLNDPTYLGAEVELSFGPEKEKHIINKSALIYVPAKLEHGSFKVTKASKPFNFLEIVAGPELPGAVYG